LQKLEHNKLQELDFSFGKERQTVKPKKQKPVVVKNEAPKELSLQDQLLQKFNRLNIKNVTAVPEIDEFDGDSSADSDFADPENTLIKGKGSHTAVVGVENEFTIVARTSDGRELTVGGDDFSVRLIRRIKGPDEGPYEVEGQVQDLGNGQYRVVYVPMYLGDYDIEITLDNKHKLSHSSIRKVRVIPGDTSAFQCVVLDPLYTTQTEGQTFEFTIQARDAYGNNRTRGGDKFQMNFDYYGTNMNNRPLMVDDYADIVDQDDGTYKVTVRIPLPGKFRLVVGLEDGLIPSLDPFDFDAEIAPMPDLLINYEDFYPGSSVAQFRATIMDNVHQEFNRDNTRWVSVVCNQPIRDLTNDLRKQIEDEFRNRFTEWLKASRKNVFTKIQKANEQAMGKTEPTDEDAFKEDSSINFYWGNIDSVDNQLRCDELRTVYNQKLNIDQVQEPVNYVTITDSFTDWSNYEEWMRQRLREEEERRRQEEADRLRREQELKRLEEQRKSSQTIRLPLMDPNALNVIPRLCSVNFWMIIAAMMRQAKERNPQGVNLDEYGFIKQYETPEMTVKELRSSEVYNVARKLDVKLFGDFLLSVAQRHFFEMLKDLEKNINPMAYKVVDGDLKGCGKRTFERFKHAHTVLLKIINNNNNKLTLGGMNQYAEVDDEMLEKVKPLMLAYKRKLLVILQDAVADMFQVLKTRGGPDLSDNKKIEKMSTNCHFFKSNISELFHAYNTAYAEELSGLARKIMVQELQFAKINSKDNATTPSFSVQVPINELFDRYLYAKKRSNRGVRDRSKPGLVNPYKVAYIKENRVVWEAIRSGSLPAISISDRATRKKIAYDNAVELLTVIAANHSKRFTREELQLFSHDGEPLMVPFTSLSLLTPFFVNDREDRQVMEHQEALLEALNNNAVKQITLDVHDNGPPVTINVAFREPCYINIGVNVVIKTFMCGIGIQRAINCRSNGMRLFERKVQKFRAALGRAKQNLRKNVIQYISNVFTVQSREGQIYRKRLMDRISRVEQVFILLVQEEAATTREVSMMDYEFSQKQKELETRIKTWMENFDSITSVEYQYQMHIKSLVNELLALHKRIWQAEKKWEVRYDELVEVETTFVQELFTSVLTIQQSGNANFPQPPQWIEYTEMVKKERDLQELYNDLRFLYHNGLHEKWTQGVVETDEVKDIDNYSVPVRIIMLSFMIGEQAHFGCKSGKDRTGEAQDQCMEFAEMREQFGEYPQVKLEKKKFNEHRKQIHTNLAMNAGSLDIIRVNVALYGSKMDKSVAGRFLPGFFHKYKGLSSLDKITFESKDKAWDKYEEIASNL
jgi:hypothetical protein